MSSVSLTAPTAGGLPVLSEANAPASVRDGSAAVKQAYASAKAFEEMLLQQLSQSLTKSSGLSGEGGEEGSSEAGGEGVSGMLSSLLPQTLTEGIMREGGLGLATQLMGALDPSAGVGRGTVGQAGGASAASALDPSAGAAQGTVGHAGGASA